MFLYGEFITVLRHLSRVSCLSVEKKIRFAIKLVCDFLRWAKLMK